MVNMRALGTSSGPGREFATGGAGVTVQTGGRSVIDGAMRILKALPGTQPRGQIAELARATGLPRPTVYRLLGQLSDAGAVQMRPDGTYGLALELATLSQHAEPVSGLRRRAMGVLAGIREHTGAAVSLVVSDGVSEVALEMLPGRDRLPIDARAGARMPRATAAGRVLWPASAPPDRLRAMGAAVDHEDLIAGVSCYAAPVALPAGRLAALQVATPAVTPAENLAPIVLRASEALATALARA